MQPKLSNGDTGVESEIRLAENVHLVFSATEIRRERTGTHALLALLLRNGSTGSRLLAHDTFNLGRSEERKRLAKGAVELLSPDLKALLPLGHLVQYLDAFTLEVDPVWENRFSVTEEHGLETLPPQEFVLRPYLPLGAGAIMFAPPGKGKSFVALLMAQSIAHSVSRLWQVDGKAKPLYVNLERDAVGFARRLTGINKALGLSVRAGLPVLHARGRSLTDLKARLRTLVKQGGYNAIFLDSISRAGAGSLIEDQTANATIDTLNSICPTWFAIGHSPRGDDKHLFGSMHFEAGMDVGIRLQSQEIKDDLGIALEVTKVNDMKRPAIAVYRLSFDIDGVLSAVKPSRLEDWPELAGNANLPVDQRIKQVIQASPDAEATPSEIAEALQMPHSNVLRSLRDRKLFTQVRSEGRKTYYGVTADENPF